MNKVCFKPGVELRAGTYEVTARIYSDGKNVALVDALHKPIAIPVENPTITFDCWYWFCLLSLVAGGLVGYLVGSAPRRERRRRRIQK